MSLNIGFFAHANCNRYGGKLHPIEVAFADVRTLEVLITTVSNSDKFVGPADEMANKYCSRNIHRLPHNFQGSFSWNCVIDRLKEEYRRKDNGLNLLVAVRGVQQKKIFQEANLPIVELKEVYTVCPSYYRLPSYEDFWGILDMDDDHCRLHRGTYRCSRRIAYSYARYIQERKQKDVELTNQICAFERNLRNVYLTEITVEKNFVTIKISTN